MCQNGEPVSVGGVGSVLEQLMVPDSLLPSMAVRLLQCPGIDNSFGSPSWEPPAWLVLSSDIITCHFRSLLSKEENKMKNFCCFIYLYKFYVLFLSFYLVFHLKSINNDSRNKIADQEFFILSKPNSEMI